MNSPAPINLPRPLTREQKRAFLHKGVLFPSLIAIATLTAYAGSLTAALAAPLWIAVPTSLLCGLAIGLLFIVGHDCCHQAFTGSRMANNVLGRVVFLPSLHPYSLWDLGHNRTHHRYNNVRGKDYVWEPMTPRQYRVAKLATRAAYRFFRSPPGIFCYYGVEIWAKRMILVVPWRLPDRRGAYWWDLITVWTFAPLQSLLVIWIGSLFGRAAGYSLLLGMIVPFLVWNALMSFVIYLHHTHPAIRWYSSIPEWRAANGKVSGTAHVRFPYLVDKILLHIMKHNGHHHLPGAPLYNLTHLQEQIEPIGAVSWRFSPRAFLNVCRRCKLFDYETGSWRGFEEAAQ